MAELIREVIIVEGRDDIDAVQKAVSADIIATHGYGISASTLDRIRRAYETRGIIILTDPDHAGGRIRKRLTELSRKRDRPMFPGEKQKTVMISGLRTQNLRSSAGLLKLQEGR